MMIKNYQSRLISPSVPRIILMSFIGFTLGSWNIEAVASQTPLDAASYQAPLEPDKLPQRRALPNKDQLKYVKSSELAPTPPATPLAENPPGPADLSETTDVQFTPPLQAKAAMMRHDATQIFNWVRSNITFTPTFGSIQGSEGCRLARECNAFDTASLLISLLRSSNVPARYIIGDVALDPSFFKSAMGSFTDINAAGLFAASSGIPTTFVTDAVGNVIEVRIKHVWVAAYLLNPATGKSVWVNMDASLKKLSFQSPRNLQDALQLTANSFKNVLSEASFDANGDSISNIDGSQISGQIQQLQTNLQDLLASNLVNDKVAKVTGSVQPDVRHVGNIFKDTVFTGRILQVASGTNELPPSSRHALTLTISDLLGTQSVTITRTLPDLALKRLTIGYAPATPADVEFVSANGGLFNAPPVSFMVRPIVYLDSEIIGVGQPTPMGVFQRYRIAFQGPDGANDFVDHFVRAGTYAAVGLNLQRVGSEALNTRVDRIAETLAQLAQKSPVELDDVIGEILHAQAQTYYALLDMQTRLSANKLNVVFGRRPAEMLMTFAPVYTFDINGLPTGTLQSAMSMDFKRNIVSLSARNASPGSEGSFLFGIGAYSSALEHSIFEIIQRTASVSTLKLIHKANDQGIPIFAINAQNVERSLPQLTLPSFVLDDINQAAEAGKFILTPKDPIQFSLWQGVGYMVIDPVTGGGGYLINGGIAGGATAENNSNLDAGKGIINGSYYVYDDNGMPVIMLSDPNNPIVAPSNAISSEGLTLISQELEITQQDVTVYESPAVSIGSLSSCSQARLANALSATLLNGLLWNNVFGSTLGIPSTETYVPSLSAFVFDFIQEKLKQLREEGLICQ